MWFIIMLVLIPREASKLKESEEEKTADDPIARQLVELQAQADKVSPPPPLISQSLAR